MIISPDGLNPRDAHAHASLTVQNFEIGKTDYETAVLAVIDASRDQSDPDPELVAQLGRKAVLFVHWNSTSFEDPINIHHDFGGYVMRQSDGIRWTKEALAISARRFALSEDSRLSPDEDAQLRTMYDDFYRIHTLDYPTAKFTRVIPRDTLTTNGIFPTCNTAVNTAEIPGVIAFNSQTTL